MHANFVIMSIRHKEQQDKWRGVRYASIFSRRNIENIFCDDFTLFDELIQTYDKQIVGQDIINYKNYFCYAFRYLMRNYRNEYIVKNALLNNLIKHHGTSQTVAFNEFRVGKSIADLVLFNGNSRAYEIKTEYDSPKRLGTQMIDYNELFQFCYLVVHEQYYEKYHKDINSNVGVIIYSLDKGHIHFEEKQSATENTNINPYLLMRCLRTEEYKRIVSLYYDSLPEMNAFTAFEICEELMANVPASKLHEFFISTMKERRSNMKYLKEYESYLRQLCLSMHIMPKEYDILYSKLLTNITI